MVCRVSNIDVRPGETILGFSNLELYQILSNLGMQNNVDRKKLKLFSL